MACDTRTRRSLLLAFSLALAAAACGPAQNEARPPIASGDWLEFTGTWTAAGSRNSIALGAERRSSIVNLRGSLLLAGAGRPGVGFHSEVLGLSDSASGFSGRSAWTDEHGDQVYSELQGEGTAEKNHIRGTIFGGTGRYSGATGMYEFSWQWVMEAEDGSIQGRASDLKGRVRRGSAAEGTPR